ncbi:hypothetical protein SADUNF_Sadunf03G0058300 [Salix dunnii]|uniref:Protein kinase domain-containing protein n=1 Tax=Salix dunnii TaxID=1413687 RepID=A0A835N1Q4_9ROSI|nr:hypothetical protein SADUNF_Sadunf03G0058300 [Salix dunnii]
MKCFHIFKEKSKNVKGKANSAPELRDQRKPDSSASRRTAKSLPCPRSVPESYKVNEHKLRVFSFQELREATNGFNRLLKIGEGGFGSVYKGTIRPANGQGDPTVVAIKKLNNHGLQVQSHCFFVIAVLNLSFPIASFIHAKSKSVLIKEYGGFCTFMLSSCGYDAILKMSVWTCKVLGTYGYAAPEYVETGHLASQSDIWSFGVVLYEILTGRRTVDRNRPAAEQKLLYWVKQFPADSSKFSMIIDPRLRNEYSIKAAKQIAKLADSCLNKNPKERPAMTQVVASLKQIIQDLEGGNSSTNKNIAESSQSSLNRRRQKNKV